MTKEEFRNRFGTSPMRWPGSPYAIGLAKFISTAQQLLGRHSLTVVEVGSFAGESTKMFLDMGIAAIYCVDPWKSNATDEVLMKIARFEAVEAYFDMQFKSDPRVIKCKGTLDDMPHLTGVDLVYVDGSHLRESVMSDVRLAIEKFDPPLIGGHDYDWRRFPGVPSGVRETLGTPDFHFVDSSWLTLRKEIHGNAL